MVVETHIDGERFVAIDTNKPDVSSVRYASGEKQYLIFPDPKVQQEYQVYENGSVEETLYLKDRSDITWNVELASGSYLEATSDGGYKVVNPSSDENADGYIKIGAPSGTDATGAHISYTYELTDDHTLTLIDPDGHLNDNREVITYPVVVDPTIEHVYNLVLLMHGNIEPSNNFVTNQYPDSSRYLRQGVCLGVKCNINTTQMSFGNASIFLNGSATIPTNITIADSNDFTFGTNNFSIFASVYYPTAFPTNGIALYKQQADATNYDVLKFSDTTHAQFQSLRASVTKIDTTSVALSSSLVAGKWYQLGFIMNGTNGQLYLNGTPIGSPVTRSGALSDMSAVVQIGGGTSQLYTGDMLIDEVSVVNGGSAPTNTTFGSEYPLYLNASYNGPNLGYADDNNTVSLLHFDGVNGGTFFQDEVGNRTWTATAATTNTSQYKFSPSSGWFAGSTSKIVASNGSSFDFGSGDFTIDFWYNKIGTAGAYGAIFTTNSTGASGLAILDVPASGNIQAFASSTNDASVWDILNGVSLGAVDSPGTWTHFALSRSGNKFYGFKNGQLISTTTNAGAIPPSSGSVTIGKTSVWNLPNANVEEFRATKGLGRWVAPFAVPTDSYELISNQSFVASPAALPNTGTAAFTDATPSSAWTNNSFLWTFGDGGISTSQNPTHAYASTGIYTVTENVYNNNMTASTSQTYKVGAPVVDFAGSPMAGTAALSVTFTDLTTNATPITSYLIDFGDGQTSTVTPPWLHVYSSFGSYSVNLTETNSVGTSYNYKRDYIVTSTVQNQQQTWYTPHQVRYKIVDAFQSPLPGSIVTAYYVNTTLPSSNTSWLQVAYGVPATVVTGMMNSGLAMQGTSGNDGYVTFTQHGSLQYSIFVTSTSASVYNYTTLVYPMDNEYVLSIQKNPVIESNQNNTYLEIYNTSLWVSFPNVSYIRCGLNYTDTSGATTNVKFKVWDGLNDTVYYASDLGNPGTVQVQSWYDLPNLRGNRYFWNYSATRTP